MAMARSTFLLFGLLAVGAQWGVVHSQGVLRADVQENAFAVTEPNQSSTLPDADENADGSFKFASEVSIDENGIQSSESDPALADTASDGTVDDPEYSGNVESLYAAPGEETNSAENPDPVDDNAVDVDNYSGGDSLATDSSNDFGMVENDDDWSENLQNSEVSFGDASIASKPSCGTGNPIDDCWRCDSNWASNRKRLASCATGFGRSAIGGKNGRIYVVTSPRDDNPADPAPGTLRYAVTRPGSLWITFQRSMTIKLMNELLITSYKTIDGRGAVVRIAGGGGLTCQRVSNVIIHGIAITDIKATGPGRIMSSSTHVGTRNRCDGDAISIFASKNVWIDHCYLARATDGLVDVIRGSTGVSITNNYFTQHDKVMLFGANKNDKMDRGMFVTVAYNVFGPKLMQRMPRVRYGNVHVVNNDYTSGWGIYAIAGSEDPTIFSQGNVFNAYKGSKQVTKRINDGGPSFGGPKNWNWRSEGDKYLSGAYFTSVPMKWSAQSYSKTASCSARPAGWVTTMVRGAGPLNCDRSGRC